jgi:hypothetical protein
VVQRRQAKEGTRLVKDRAIDLYEAKVSALSAYLLDWLSTVHL